MTLRGALDPKVCSFTAAQMIFFAKNRRIRTQTHLIEMIELIKPKVTPTPKNRSLNEKKAHEPLNRLARHSDRNARDEDWDLLNPVLDLAAGPQTQKRRIATMAKAAKKVRKKSTKVAKKAAPKRKKAAPKRKKAAVKKAAPKRKKAAGKKKVARKVKKKAAGRKTKRRAKKK